MAQLDNTKDDYPGAKWWEFDFHTHTPASNDFMQACNQTTKDEVTPESWLQKFIKKGISCVAITDHNTGEWVDKLKQANQTLNNPLTLFPGVEISADGGVHILAIFGPDKTTSDIDSLLGTVDYKGTKGDSDAVTKESITKVIDIITEKGGIAIPAHADREKGLFQLTGNTLKQILENTNIFAIELCDENYLKPQLYRDKKIQWSEVLGSDTHNFKQDSFGKFTWIKMDTPNIEGLRLALIDGKTSVKRDMNTNPNQHSDYIIESLKVTKAKYMGREKPLNCEFSPFLNTIIGGRGSGKSTLLEFMRFVFRRHNEIPDTIKDNKYFTTGGDNLLTEQSILSLIYKKGDTRYRLNWSADASVNSLQVENNEQWVAEEGEIASLFPVHIYSQKQIFELAKNSEALLDIIDKNERVKFSDFQTTQKQLTHKYKQTAQKTNEVEEKIAQKNKLTGELNDLNRQIEQIEKSGHKQVLQNYRKHQRQLTIIERIENEWQENSNSLENIIENIAPVDFDAATFDGQEKMLNALQKSNNKWQKINQKVAQISQESKKIIKDWQQEKQNSLWMKALQTEIAKYEQIKTQLQQQGIDPEKYPFLLQQQAQKQKNLAKISAYEATLNSLKNKTE